MSLKRVYIVLLILLASNVDYAPGQEIRTLDRQDWIELKAVHQDMYTRIGPPAEFLTQRTPTANFSVTYNGFSPAAQTAFQFAVDIWAALIGSPVTIRVTANWTSLTTGVLGSAAANGAVRDFPGAPVSGTWYAMPLAEMLFGGNVNHADSADIIGNFNSNRSDWYLGTDGNPPSGEIDLVTVVLHELCHGLGFAGSMTVSGGMGSWGLGSGFPFAYDLSPENGSGEQLITVFPNPSAALAAQLTGDDIYFNSPNAVVANGGSPPKLYAPSSWDQGSSYSHLDEATFSAGNPNSLMTPQLGQAEAIHSPGAITLGMFEDMGWTIITIPSYPTTYTVSTTVSFRSLTRPSDYSPTDYRIVGLPGNSNSSIESFLPGDQNIDWQVFWDNGTPSDYLVPFDGGSNFAFSVGRAFWVIKKGPWIISTNVPTAPLNATQEVEIPLHSGWNLIANPFDSTVSWAEIQTANSFSEPIYTFSGSFSSTSNFDPYVGYYFFNSANLPVLKVPYAALFTNPAGAGGPDPAQWKISIALSSGEFLDKTTSLGISPKSRVGLDSLDFRKPRGVADMPTAYFFRPEWDASYNTFATDIRPRIQQVEEWTFRVQSPKREKSQLAFTGISQLPWNLQVYLLDEKRARYRNLREDSVYNFTSATDLCTFSVIVGEDEAVQERLSLVLPKAFALGNNFPNPFNTSTTIAVSIPYSSDVSLRIYNMLGESVRTVYVGTLEAGRHWLVWEGRNESGRYVASGAYFLQFRSDAGVSLTRKMILLK